MRAAAQMYACAACIGTDAAATQLMQSVCRDMAQTPLPARSALVLNNLMQSRTVCMSSLSDTVTGCLHSVLGSDAW